MAKIFQGYAKKKKKKKKRKYCEMKNILHLICY